jgi:hypothetical protein
MTFAEQLVRRNALLGRYAFSQLRPMACGISAGIYLTVVVLVFLLGYAAHLRPSGVLDTAGYWRSLFISFAVLQIFMLGIMGVYHAGSAIQQEVTEKSMDFFRLLPLSPAQKIVGVLVGRNLVTLTLGVANTLLLVVCGMMRGVQGWMLAEFVVFLWVATAAAMLAAFLLATLEGSGRRTSGPMVIILGSVFFLPYTIAVALNWQEFFPHGASLHFFGARLRLFAFLTLLALYAGLWLVLGLRRRFVNERASLFTPGGALACLGGLLVIALGLGWTSFPTKQEAAVLVCWTFTAIAALLIAAGTYRSWDDYFEVFGQTSVGPGLGGANLSNLSVGTAMLLLWGGAALVADQLAADAIAAVSIPVLITFGLVLLFLLEFSITHAPLTMRMRGLAAFLAGLYFVLPLIISAVTDNGYYLRFNPCGYLVQMDKDPASWRMPVMANMVWLLALGAFIQRRYRIMAQARPESAPGVGNRGPGEQGRQTC